jgi:hypothetical protein
MLAVWITICLLVILVVAVSFFISRSNKKRGYRANYPRTETENHGPDAMDHQKVPDVYRDGRFGLPEGRVGLPPDCDDDHPRDPAP